MATWQETVGQQWDTFVQQTWDSALDYLSINFPVGVGYTIAVESTIERSLTYAFSPSLQTEEATIYFESLTFSAQLVFGHAVILQLSFTTQYDIELDFTEVHNIDYDLVVVYDLELGLVISDANLFFNTVNFDVELELTGSTVKQLNETPAESFNLGLTITLEQDVTFRDSLSYGLLLEYIPGTPNWYRESPVLDDTWFDEGEA